MEGGLNRGHKEGDIRKEIELVMWGRMKRFLKGAGMSAVLFALFSTNVLFDIYGKFWNKMGIDYSSAGREL